MQGATVESNNTSDTGEYDVNTGLDRQLSEEDRLLDEDDDWKAL